MALSYNSQRIILMKSTAKETGMQGRIVNLASTAHRRSDGKGFDLNKLNNESKYNAFSAYAHSKLANILHANELSRRFQEEGCDLTANSLHPGIIGTNIVRYITTNSVLASIFSLVKPFVKDIPQGAATTCYVALHPDTKGVSGKYFAGCNEATPTSVARDAELAKRLWAFSEELVENRSK
ncbi:unnamed protein product [Triticum turgidum subsp. durum]|uniref:Short-chain dehydrogenase TIC 32, chloroplastic-like n=1 Tax=Triticum turgidum subsp. durum TaxID=4567 RepID=A0A9R0SX83_TRITD|nr:unnamed protein product [Triticum turgidum subsp. durum]